MADIFGLGLDDAPDGIFGIFATALVRMAGYFERKQTFKHEVQRWGHEYKIHELRLQAQAQETEMELALAAQEGSWRGLDASIEADSNIGKASLWVINTLRLVRPTLTLLLWLITGWIFAVTQNGAIVEAAVFAATAATLWWFGDRAPKPPMRRDR